MDNKVLIIIFSSFLISKSNKLLCQNCFYIDSNVCYYNKEYPKDITFSIEKQGESEDFVSSVTTPLLADIDGDCIPEIFMPKSATNEFSLLSEDIIIINSQTRKTIRTIETPKFNLNTNPFVIADINYDGIVEIIIAVSRNLSIPIVYRNRIMCFDIEGNIIWVSNQQYGKNVSNIAFGNLGIADFNQDGNSEVYIFNEIFNAQTGVKLVDGGKNGVGINSNFEDYSTTIAVNFDDNQNDLELIAGYTMYKIVLNNLIGESSNLIVALNFELDNENVDGFTSIGDINNDGKLDAIINHSSFFNRVCKTYAYTFVNNKLELIAFKFYTDKIGLGPPSITKRNNYNLIYFNSYAENKLNCLYYDGTYDFKVKWKIDIEDKSGLSTPAIFDLNNDGKDEIIIRGDEKLCIYNDSGSFASKIFEVNCFSATLIENAVIANLDNSGQAKICAPCSHELFNIKSRLTVFGSPDTLLGWAPARGIWNQYNYHVLNINYDGTVPQYMHNNATYKNGKYNNFFVQESLLDSLGRYPQKAASLTGKINCVNYNTTTKQYEIDFDINNRTDASLYAKNNLPVSFYNGNPETGGKLIGKFYTTDTIFSGSNLRDLTYSFSSDSITHLFLVVNTERDSLGSFKEHHFLQLECDYTDNFYQFALPQITKTTAAICSGESYNFYEDTLTTEGIFYHTEKNNDGCDSVILELELIIEDTISITNTLATCDNYTWNGNVYTQSGEFTFAKTTAAGCDSIATLNLTINKSSNITTIATTCDTFSWLGTVYDETGIYTFTTQTTAGCDSVMRLELSVIPPDSIMLPRQEICEGDSIIFLGKWYKKATNATIKLKNQYDCDSFITFELRVIDTLKTYELKSICEGDSIRIFDEWKSEEGSYQKTFQSTRGCDSLATINLTLHSTFQLQRSTKICDGDSIFLFNEWKKSSGIFIQKYQTINGCDSIEQVELIVEPLLVKNDSILICKGDSIFVNGNNYSEEGSYQTILSSTEGCDTIYNFQLKYSPLLLKTENYSICEGDSILINNSWIKNESEVKYFIEEENCKTEITANVTVKPSTLNLQQFTLCPDETITINNIIINESTELNYTLQSTEGCDSIIQAKVTKLTWPEPPVVELDCEDNVYNASINADNWDITWLDSAGSPTATGSITTISKSPASVRVRNDNDCERYYTLNIEDLPDLSQLPSFDNQNINDGDDINVRVELYTTEWDVKWSPTHAVSCDTCFETTIAVDTNTTITLELKHLNSCTYIRTFNVILEKVKINIIIPNIINTSSSGSNNTWTVLIPDGYEVEEVKVYDRWGSLVYGFGGIGYKPIPAASNNITWDGKLNGSYVVPGVYLYFIRLINPEGKLEVIRGDVTVIR